MTSIEREQPRTLPWAKRLSAVRRAVFKGLEAVTFVLVVVILGLVAVQVFTRYVLQIPVNWLEEAARMLLVWLVMLGAAVAAERREHYVINIIIDMLPARVALVILTLANVLGVAFLAILAVKGVQYAQSGMTAFYVSLNIPRGYVYLALPIGALLMGFSLVSQSIDAWLAPRAAAGAKGAPGGAEAPALPHE